MLLTSFETLFLIHKDIAIDVFPTFTELDWDGEIKNKWINDLEGLVDATNEFIDMCDKPYNKYEIINGEIFEKTGDTIMNILVAQMKKEIGL